MKETEFHEANVPRCWLRSCSRCSWPSCSQQASLSVALGSASGSVVRGDQVSVPVTVSNASGSVTLSVSGAPAGVTASLASTTLSGGATSTTLDVQVSAAVAEGATTLTVDATEGSNAASATYDVTITSLSVHGKVVGLLDIPVAGAVVSIQGTNAFTASDGSFTVGGVAVPYDLAVIQHGTTPSTGYAHVFQGLTTSNPTVLPVSVLSGTGTPQSATITGTLGSAVATGYTAKVACKRCLGGGVRLRDRACRRHQLLAPGGLGVRADRCRDGPGARGADRCQRGRDRLRQVRHGQRHPVQRRQHAGHREPGQRGPRQRRCRRTSPSLPATRSTASP